MALCRISLGIQKNVAINTLIKDTTDEVGLIFVNRAVTPLVMGIAPALAAGSNTAKVTFLVI